MKSTFVIGFTTLFIGLIAVAGQTQANETGEDKAYRDPNRFEEDIQRFEDSDRESPPQRGAVLCIGSSSMRGWHKTLDEDLAPLTLIPRGFGGSNMNDLLYYSDRVVLPYRPRAIVVYEGDNDTAQDIAPAKIAETFRAFVTIVHRELPQCRIYFLSIKPSIKRWDMWPRMVEANTLIATQCANDNRLNYVDVARGMLGDDGTPRREIFKDDDLHMNRAGYVIWRDTLRPILLEGERLYEK